MDSLDALRCFLWWLFYLCFMSGHVNSADYRLGYIASDTNNFMDWKDNEAAVYMALDRVEREGFLGHETNIRIVTSKDACGTPHEHMGAFERLYVEHNVHGFIGIGCSRNLIYAGYLATYWNLPMLSQSAASHAFADRSLYPTIIRLLPPNNKLGLAMKEIIPYFGWKHIFMVYRANGLTLYAAQATAAQMYTVGVTVAGEVGYDVVLEDSVIDEALAEIKHKARIIFLCGTDEQEIRFMVRAHELGMTSPDYVYLSPTYRATVKPYTPWLWEQVEENRAVIKEAMQSVIQITTSFREDDILDAFRKEFTKRMSGPPWFVPDREPSLYAATLYDSVYLYALALNASLEQGEDGRDGRQLIKRAINITFEGMTGHVDFDEKAERDPIYSLYCLRPESESLTLVAHVAPHIADQKFRLIESDIWRTSDGLPPPDVPPCGFHGENCLPQDKSSFLVTIGVLVALLLFLIIGVLLFWLTRRRQLERELENMLWRISSDELNILTGSQIGTNMSLACLKNAASKSIMWTNKSNKSLAGPASQQHEDYQLFTKVALYKGQVVAVKPVALSVINLSRQDQREIKAIRDLEHENINTLLGACIDVPNVCVVTSYCARGSLQDILHNDNITLDNVFKESFIFDIIKAMCYLHGSAVGSHGKLKTCNCVVDSRWVLKITDIDPSCLQRGLAHDAGEYEIYRGMLWTAPELLRNYGKPRGTPEGDVYSFGIIMQEIVFRALPFFIDVHDISPKEIVERIRKPNGPGYRPKCPPADGVKLGILELMQSCWNETPANRPTFGFIKKAMHKLGSGKSLNIVDNILHKLEVYAGNLETLVEGRTIELLDEKKKTDMLLYQMLPKSIVNQLKIGKLVQPELVDEVTLYFSEIDDFLNLSIESSPMQIIHLLNSLYEMMDNLLTMFDVYKVETIGDAYMVVSGLPNRNGRKHVTEIADMALNILSSSLHFRINHLPRRKLKLRAGIHTGPCCAGVVGLAMPRYCLFGDSVNTASRMQSHGKVLRIHISQSTYQGLCDANEEYVTSLRGEMDIKGKGKQITYWLEGKLGFTKPLPKPTDG